MNEQKNDLKVMLKNKFSELPFHRFMGLSVDCFDRDNGRINFDMRDELIGNRFFKILHGGVIATILDTEGGFLLILNGAWDSEDNSSDDQRIFRGGTVDLRVDYLRPGKGKHPATPLP